MNDTSLITTVNLALAVVTLSLWGRVLLSVARELRHRA
jgi:hypothetical protein